VRHIPALIVTLALFPAIPGATPAAAQAAEQGAFVVLMGRDTFAVENFSRSADRLEAEMTGPSIGRLVYQVRLGPTAVTRVLMLQAWQPGAAEDAAPMQEVRLTAQGDSVIVGINTAAGSQTQRIASREDAMQHVNPSFALTEQIILRARAIGGDEVQVPVFLLQGGQTLNAVVTWPAEDSVVLVLGGSAVRGTLSPTGRLLSAAIPAQNLTITRVEGAHVAPSTSTPPDYSAPTDAPYEAEDVRIDAPGGHTLAGTLTRPMTGSPLPAVVLITGSGAQDRDQAIPMVRGYRPFREIADTLSRRGIAVLRLDDRGFGASTGDFATSTSADFADDVHAALAWLRARSDIDGARLGLVGHSEGGLIAPLVAAMDTALAGIVLIAGPAQTGREIIEYQQRQAIDASELPPASRDSAASEAKRQLEEMAARQPWIRFFLEHDPQPTARQVRRTPVLILHGETDRQVTVEQAEVLATAFREGGNPDVTVRVFPDINHLMLHDPHGAPSGYASLDARTVARVVLGTLADWTADRLGARTGAPLDR
jgi:uncharacterized protein